ncbi:ClpX C4-type zinc finger protein [Oceanobacillus jeddahense]
MGSYKLDDENSLFQCSFCGKEEEVRKLAAGLGVYICNECAE